MVGARVTGLRGEAAYPTRSLGKSELNRLESRKASELATHSTGTEAQPDRKQSQFGRKVAAGALCSAAGT